MKMINEKSKIKTFISLIVLFAIMLMMNNVYAGMADFDDKTADAQANEQLANQEKAESGNAGKSSNNYLAALEIDGYKLSPEFDKQTQEYTLNSEVKEDSITIKATADDEKATVTGTGNIKLQTGENNLRIDVKAESGTVRTYFVKVTRKIEDETLRLSSIKLSAVDQNGNKDELELSPAFSENVFSYTTRVYNGASKVDVNAISSNEDAKVTVEGNNDLKDGNNSIIITVYKEGTTGTVSYKIDVIRENNIVTNSTVATAEQNNKLAILAIIIVVIILLVLLRRKKKKSRH